MRCRKSTRRIGLTLVETLAVIVIVASLSALLFPVMAGARKSGWQVVCGSNLQQIGRATGLYLGDYGDHFPISVNAFEREDPSIRLGRGKEDDPNNFPTPLEVLSPYTREPRLFVCPLDLGASIGGKFRAYPRLHPRNGGSSYLFAELFQGQTQSTWSNPSRAIWACDGSPSWHSRSFNGYDFSTFAIMAVHYDFNVKLVRNQNAPTFLE